MSIRIGVIRFSSLGDIVLTSPAIRCLRNAYPSSEIVFITNPAYRDLAAAIPGVDRVEEVARRGAAFERGADRLARLLTWDRVADLQGSPRSRRLRKLLGAADVLVDSPPRLRRILLLATRLRFGGFEPVPLRIIRSLAPWGVTDDRRGIALRLSEEVSERVEKKWPLAASQPYILAPGSRHETKRWPDRYWVDLAGELTRAAPVIILGVGGDTPVELERIANSDSNVLDLTGRTELVETMAVLKGARAVVTGDTGPMHLAVALDTPLVALFGPTVEEFGFFPFRPSRAEVLQRKLWCRPCSAHGSSSCPLRHHRCLDTIMPDEVFSAIRRVELPKKRKRRVMRKEDDKR